MELRSNQIEPVRIGVEYFLQKNAEPSIIVAPTAFGKSHVIAKIAEAVNDRVLILQPSKELLEQNYLKFCDLGGIASIYSASFGRKDIGRVTYATIGSIKDIGNIFKAYNFTKMIIDECHLYPRGVESMLGGFLKDSGITHVLGLTATPLKLQNNVDKYGMPFSKLVMLTSRSKKGNFFKEILYVSQVKEMVDLGFWSKLEYEQYDIDQSRLVYNSTKADYTEESLNAVYQHNNTDDKIVAKLKELEGKRKSVLVFVPNVANAIALVDRVPGSVSVYGDMDKKERDAAVNGFKAGKIRVVINVNVLSVGFDHPGLDCVIMARPTASLAWYYQALGRLTRILEGKIDGLVVDFSGNVKKFGKVEKLEIVKEGVMWKVYGEGGILLTGIPLHEVGEHKKYVAGEVVGEPGIIIMPFGKFKDQPITVLPKWYVTWAVENIKWNDNQQHIKKGLEAML